MFLFTAIFMMILTGAEVDLFVPSFPQLQQIFNLTPFMVELTLGVNLVAHCITAFIAGNLGDKYGRKPVIITGLIIFIIGSILCVFAPYYWVLLLGRALQGIGISGPAVLTYVLISDKYAVKKMQHLMGMVNASVTIAMASAPVVGSYVNLFFNWQGNFVILLIFGIISLLLVIFFIPKNNHAKQSIKISLKEYLPIFKSKKATLYLISICFAMQSYWIFIGMSPILYMEDLGVSLKEFGLYQGAIAAVFAIGSLTSSYFIKRFGQYKCMIVAKYLVIIFFSFTLGLVIFNIKNPIFITISMLFQAIGMVYPINILWPLAVNSVKDAKGRIGALLVSFRLIISSIAISIASYYYNGTFLTIGSTICITLIISSIACYKLFKTYKVLQD
jgi:DHA1 family bicyclomycin/chloramphenicol resistance-like MFS transporter